MKNRNKKYSGLTLPFTGYLPRSFERAWKDNQSLQRLWNNDGDLSNDVEKADFLLIKEAIKNNIYDIRDLYAILILKPEGAFQKLDKDESYLRIIISRAIYEWA